MASKKLTTGILTAIIVMLVVCIVLLFFSSYDDAYQSECSNPRFGPIVCIGKYFIFWVLPYWWVIILVIGAVIGVFAGVVQRN